MTTHVCTTWFDPSDVNFKVLSNPVDKMVSLFVVCLTSLICAL